MKKRILIFGILTSIIQTILYFVCLKFVQLIRNIFLNELHKLTTNYFILLLLILFVASVFTQNILSAIVNRKWFTWIAFTLSFVFMILGWTEGFSLFTSLTFTSIILLVLLSKFYIDKILSKYLLGKEAAA